MNKLTKLLSIFLLAGVIGTGAAFTLTACSNEPEPETPPVDTPATEYTVTFNANGHGTAPAAATTVSGKATKPTDLTESGWVFGGWYENAECTGTAVDFSTKVFTQNTTLYAKWTQAAAPTEKKLIVEGIESGTTYTLSSEKTSHALDLSVLDVYLSDDGSTKGDKVAAADITFEVYFEDDAEPLTATEYGALTKDGDYSILVTVSGTKGYEVNFSVSNPIAAIALKTGTTTFTQGDTASTADWTFEATRANGDKEPVTGVTVGSINTDIAGSISVDLSLANNKLGTATLTIQANDSLHIQSYAVNINNYLSEVTLGTVKDYTENGTLDETNGVDYIATSEKKFSIDNNHSKDYSENDQVVKSFLGRFKLAGDANGITLKNLNASVTGATVKTKVTIYAISGSSSAKRFLTYKYKDTLEVANAVLLDGSNIVKAEFMLTEAGDYTFCTAQKKEFEGEGGHPDASSAGGNGGINLYYIQVDKYVTGGVGVEDQPLTGENVVGKLKVDTANAKTVFKQGEAFTSEGITGTVTLTNSATADASTANLTASELTVTPPADMTTLGQKDVTVTYNGVSTTYKITIESAVDGVTGITAGDKLESKQVDSSSDTLSLTLNDLTATVVGSNGHNATATVTSATYVEKDTGGTPVAIDGTVQLAADKTYVITITATVSTMADGEYEAQSTTLTASCEIKVTVKPAAGDLTDMTLLANDLTVVTYTETTVLKSDSSTTISATSSVSVDENSKKWHNGKGDVIAFTKRIKLNGAKGTTTANSLKIDVGGAGTIVLYTYSSSSGTAGVLRLLNSSGTEITTGIAMAVDDGSGGETAVTDITGSGNTLTKITITVSEATTIYVAAGSQSFNIYGIVVSYS